MVTPVGPLVRSRVRGVAVGGGGVVVVVVTVKVSESVAEPAIAVMVCGPAVAPEGIAIDEMKIPLVRVLEISPPVGVSVVESNRIKSGVLAGKLVPVMVTVLPTAPDAVESSIAAVEVGGGVVVVVVTVKVAVTVTVPAVTEIV
jgi:hypothetical protein